MAGFNFGSLKTTQAISTNKPMLKPWGIYDVTFSGVTKNEFTGKKDPSKTYKVMRVRFDAPEGYYTESLFFPETEKDAERPTYQNAEGHDYQVASNVDRAKGLVAQIAAVINPEGWEKMQAKSDKYNTFEEIVDDLIKITDKKKGTATKLKLVGKNQQGTIVPALPRFVAINKDGEAFTSDNFIGDAVGFSPYEEGRRNQYLNAKPVAMPDSSADIIEDSSLEDSSDLDDLDI